MLNISEGGHNNLYHDLMLNLFLVDFRFVFLLFVAIQQCRSQAFCPKVCPPGQQTLGNVCARMVQIGQRCDRLRLCQPAFSTCQNGICLCMHGFVAFNGHCSPKSITCPQATGAPRVLFNERCTVSMDLCHNAFPQPPPDQQPAPVVAPTIPPQTQPPFNPNIQATPGPQPRPPPFPTPPQPPIEFQTFGPPTPFPRINGQFGPNGRGGPGRGTATNSIQGGNGTISQPGQPLQPLSPNSPNGNVGGFGVGGSTGEDLDSLSERLSDSFGCLPTNHAPLFTVSRHGNRTHGRTRGKRHVESQIDKQCPNTHFCYVYAAYAVNGCKVKAFGHCCPHACPIGLPHPTASCDSDSVNPCSQHDGYYCSRTFLTEPTTKYFGRNVDQHFLATCCPSHCPRGYIALSDGHCLPKANFGESCWRDEQCGFSISCVRGRCGCKEFEKPVFRENDRHRSCVVEQSLLRLGDSCNPHQTCGPPNSYCDVNSRRCKCSCGFQRTNNGCIAVQRDCPGDRHPSCTAWGFRGECERNPDWMKINCPRTCRSC